ncbi:MAG: hypothetical protein E7280_07900 [Lachnospiraceae bacterium]|nr:hypothetical protein [Lachnospiraceae bacterium]
MGLKFTIIATVILTQIFFCGYFYTHKHMVGRPLAYAKLGKKQGREVLVIVNGYRKESHLEISKEGIPIYVLQEPLFLGLGYNKVFGYPIIEDKIESKEKSTEEYVEFLHAGIGFSRRYYLRWKALLIPAAIGAGSFIIGAPNPNLMGILIFVLAAEVLWLFDTLMLFPSKWRWKWSWKCLKSNRRRKVLEKGKVAVPPQIFDELKDWLDSLGLKEELA